MVHKKYIEKNGKRYGPYYYESYRDSEGNVKKRYIAHPKKSFFETIKNRRVTTFIALFTVLVLAFSYIYITGNPFTGGVVSEILPVYSLGETLGGKIQFNLREGEFIPADALVTIRNGDQVKQILLSDLLLDQQKTTGDFYLENAELSGQGEGFGVAGKKRTSPEILFELAISEKDSETIIPSENQTTSQNETETNETIIPDLNETEAPVSNDSETPALNETESEENEVQTPTEPEVPVESETPSVPESSEATEVPEQQGEAAETIENTGSNLETSENPSESSSSLLTGAVISEESQIIQASVRKGENYIYDLAENLQAEIVAGSAKVQGVLIDDSYLSLNTEDNQAVISTDYEIVEQGFGEIYLGNYNFTLELDLSEFEINVSDPLIQLSVSYNDSVLLQAESMVLIEGQENLTANLTFENVTLIQEIPPQEINKNEQIQLNLGEYFFNAVAYEFTSQNISAEISGNILTLTPDLDYIGTSLAKIVAYSQIDSVESNQFEIIVSSNEINITTNSSPIRLGQPVKWTTNISMINPEMVKVNLPVEATNIVVKEKIKIKDSVEEEAEEEVKEEPLVENQTETNETIIIIPENETEINETIILEEENISEENLSEETFQEVPIEVNLSETTLDSSGLLTGNAVVSFNLKKQAPKKSFSFFTRFYSFLTGNVIEEQQEIISPGILVDEVSKIIEVELPANSTEYVIEYETPAPVSFEQDLTRGKQVIVSGPENLNYENVLAFTSLNESLELKDPLRLKIEWVENKSKLVPLNVLDSDGNGIYDYVEWIVPHLSNQTFNIIVIIRAEHLNENKTFISDIHNETYTLDDIWSEEIPENHYIRITFERDLTPENDITIFPEILSGNPIIEVYEKDGNETIAEFTNIQSNKYNKIFLTSLENDQNSFDLKVLNGSVKIDHIQDPPYTLQITDPTTSSPSYISSQGSTDYVYFNFLDGSTNITSGITINEVKVNGITASVENRTLEIRAGLANYTASGQTQINFSTPLSNSWYPIMATLGDDGVNMFSMHYVENPGYARHPNSTNFWIEGRGMSGDRPGNKNNHWMTLGEFNTVKNFNGFKVYCGGYSPSVGNGTINFPSSLQLNNSDYAIVTTPVNYSGGIAVTYTLKNSTHWSYRVENHADALVTADFTWCVFSYGNKTIGEKTIQAGYNTTTGGTDKVIKLNTAMPDANYVIATSTNMTGLVGDPCTIQVSTRTVNNFTIRALDDDLTNNCNGREFNWVAIPIGEYNFTEPNILYNSTHGWIAQIRTPSSGLKNLNDLFLNVSYSGNSATDTEEDAIALGYPEFQTVWNTSKTSTSSSNSTQITLPLVPTGSYSFAIRWGDGTSSIITSWNDTDMPHNYATPGVYNITISDSSGSSPSGAINGWAFNGSGDRLKLLEIKQWGNLTLGNTGGYFEGCLNLNNISADDKLMLNGTTTLSRAFYYTNLTNFEGIEDWDTSNITDMSGMFQGSKFNENISNWNTSAVTNMSWMFSSTQIFNQNISTWNTSKVTDMSYMFWGSNTFNQSINNWDVSKVTDMSGTFAGTNSFNQPLNNWNTSKVTDMSSMFSSAQVFNQNISNWSTSAVTSMSGMFNSAYAFNQSINNWDVSKVTDMSYMFGGSGNFTQNLNSWNTSSVTNMRSMFDWFTGACAGSCPEPSATTGKKFNGNISTWDTSKVTDMTSMFEGAIYFNQPLNSWNVGRVNDTSSMFLHAWAFNQPLNNWDTSNITSMYFMFANASSFDQNLSSWNVSKLNSSGYMFQNASLSLANYNALLIGWASRSPNLKNNVSFHGGNSRYSLAANASRNGTLIGTHNWTIIDGGLEGLPSFSSIAYNSSNPGQAVKFSVLINDAEALHLNGQYIFSTNNSGSWQNDTAVNFTATPSWANVTKILRPDSGAVVGYRWYATDNAGNWNGTSIAALTTADILAPRVYFAPLNNTLYGQSTKFPIVPYDNVNWGLSSRLIFSTNNTGTWVNDSPYLLAFLGYPWVNKTVNLNSTAPYKTIGYRAYLNDSSGNWNMSEKTLVTTETTAPTIQFVSPTPNDGQSLITNYAYVNVTSSDSGRGNGNVSTFIDFDSSLVSWWRMDEGSTSNFTDYTGRNNATSLGNHSSLIAQGRLGNAFDARNQQLNVDYRTWREGQSGSVTGFTMNGVATENFRELDTDPWGRQMVVWEARDTDLGWDGDGGWNSGTFSVDSSKTYRYSVWVNRKVTGANGTFYFGFYPGGGFSNATYVSTGGTTNNPYLYYTSNPPTALQLPENTWVLVVGYVYPYDYTGTTNHPNTGRYLSNGTSLGSTGHYDFKWGSASTTTSTHRTYLFYSQDPSVVQQWIYPRVDLVDGTEPTIEDLIYNPEVYSNGDLTVNVSETKTTYSFWYNNNSNSNWIHIVNSSGTTYVNGVAGTPAIYPLYVSGNSVSIGKTSSTNFFNGLIDDVIIFNRSLNAAEVAALYANSSSNYLGVNYTSLSTGTHTFKSYSQDLSGNMNATELRSITLDLSAPTYSNIAHNSSNAGRATLFSAYWDDNLFLNPSGRYIFSTNNTGTWVNETSVAFSTTPSWANVTKTLNTTGGIVIGYRWYANDSAGNWNGTAIQTLTTVDVTSPTYSNVAHNSTEAGSVVLFSALWTDETALNGGGRYIFSTNNTGTWVNETSVAFTTTPSWANVTKTLNTIAGTVVGYRWYANDSANNWNSTSIGVITVADTVAPTYSGAGHTSTQAGASSTFSITWNDNVALNPNGQYIFSTNNTGSWSNDSAVNFTTTPNAINTIKTLTTNVGAVVGYRWYAKDNAGNWNSTSISTLTTIDSIAPTYSNIAHNSSNAGRATLFSAYWNDNLALNPNGRYIFSTNNTGTWVNDSSVAFSTTPSWANVTKTLNTTVGTVVWYRWYANDSSNNWNSTTATLTVTDSIAPTYSNIAHNSSNAGRATLFSAYWNDNLALNPNGQYIFSTNNTGSWSNDSAINFTSTPNWANVTKTLNTTGGITIGYRWYAKDNAGNWNSTGINTLVTEDIVSPTYSNIAHNSTEIDLPTLFSILWNDETALNPNGQYIFSTNNSGTWSNDSAINFTSTPSWANVTKTLNDSVGIAIGYRWYAKDNAGNWNSTDIQVLTTTGATLNSCRTLSEANRVYTLTANIADDTITGDCIIISSANVTLDCAGYDIVSIKNYSGVYSNQFNTTVKNCNITMGSGSVANIEARGIEFTSGSSNAGLIYNNTINATVGRGITSGAGAGNHTLIGNNIVGALDIGILTSLSNNNTLVNNNVSTNNSNGIYMELSKWNNLTGNNVNISGGGTALIFYGINDSNFANNVGKSVSGQGITLYTNSNNNTFIGNNVTTKSGYGIYLATNTNNNNLINNIAESNSSYGIYLYSGTSNNNLTNNTGISNASQGIRIQSSTNNNLKGNIGVSNASIGIYLYSNANNNTLINNTGTSIVGTSTTVANGIRIESSTGNYLEGNNGTSVKSYGIYLTSSNNSNLINNIGMSNNSYGIYLGTNANSNSLINNIAISNTDVGLYLISASNNNLTGNNATSNARMAIYLSSNANNNILVNNTGTSIIGATSDANGIRIYSNVNNTLIGNNGTSNSTYGIYLLSINDSILTDNIGTSNVGNGIRFETSLRSNLTNNLAITNTANAFYIVTSSNNIFIGNNATTLGNANALYLITNSNNNTLINNTGTSIVGTSTTATNGIRIENSVGNNLTGNNGTSVKSYGILIFSNANNNNLIDNIGTTNNSQGIRIDGASGNNLTGNIATSNTSIGIYIVNNANNNTLTNNIGTSRDGVGIHIMTSSGNNLTGNNGTSTASYGIYLVTNANNNTLINNIGFSNTSNGIRIEASTGNNLNGNNGTSDSNYGLVLVTATGNNLINNFGLGKTQPGIFVLLSSNNNFTNNTGSANTTLGYAYSNSSNNILNGETGTSNTSIAFSLAAGSNNNILTNIQAIGYLTGSSAIGFTNSNNTIIQDCVSISGISNDILYYTSPSINNTFINCSYNTAKETVIAGSDLTRKWYYKAYVNDTTGTAVDEANVTATRSTGDVEFTELTNSSGFITTRAITEYVNNAGTRTFYNYTLDASKGVFTDSHTHNVTTSQNKLDDYFTLSDANAPTIEFVSPTPDNLNITDKDNIYVNVTSSDIGRGEGNISTFIDFDNSLVSWWRMDDANATHILDYTGKNNGTIYGDVTTSDSGAIGRSAQFDGDGDYIEVLSNSVFNTFNSNRTYSLWFEGDSYAYTQSLLARRNGCNNDGNFKISVNSNRIYFSYYTNATDKAEHYSNAILTGGVPYHAVWVKPFGQLGVKLYVNGVEQTVIADNASQGSNSSSFPVIIGAQWSSDFCHTVPTEPSEMRMFFNGSIDDVMIFNRSLSAAEVAGLYANTSSRYLGVNYTNLDDRNYTFKAYSQDTSGNVNNTETRTVTVSTNSAPIDPVVIINSTDGSNKTLQDLNCKATIIDPEANTMNVSIRWWKNDTLNLSQQFDGNYANGTLFNAVLDDSNTTKGDVWKCEMRLYDGELYSNWTNSSNLTILNSLPTVTLSSPPDGNTTTDRTPTFSWTGADDDGDSLTYQLGIMLDGSSTCSDPDRNITGISSTSHTLTEELRCLIDNGDFYLWTVAATDGVGYGAWPTQRNISIMSLIEINLTNRAINFGAMSQFEVNDTSDDNPLPFKLQNIGNALVNITVQGSSLWDSATNPTEYLKYKAANRTNASSFNFASSITGFTVMPLEGNPEMCIAELNYTDGNDIADIDVYVEVPPNEYASTNRYANITFTASLAE